MNRIFCLLLFFSPVCIKAQSIYKTWYSNESNICLSIDSTSKCFRINGFYAEDCKRIIFRKKGNKLKLIWRANQRIFPFGWRRDVSWLTIDSLTEKTLTLTLLPSKNYALEDLFYTRTVEFISKPNCEFKLKGGRNVSF